MTIGNVLGFLAAPDRETSLRAVSLSVLKIRTTGLTYKEIAKAIEVSPDTVAGAANEESLLSFDAVARLCYFWPEETGPIQELFGPAPQAPTMGDRLAQIERAVAAIRREVVA